MAFIDDFDPARAEVLNQIISSIAMQELGLSHILNAEGEKLQYALGAMPGVSGPEEASTVEDLLALNSSIHKTLENAMLNEAVLSAKLKAALSAPVMRGPTGPTGPPGPATISVEPEVTVLEPQAAARVDNLGDELNARLHFSLPRGETGATGAAGDTGPAGSNGITGATGITPTIEVGQVLPVPYDIMPHVYERYSPTGIILDFEIPAGPAGPSGAAGPTGPAGGNCEMKEGRLEAAVGSVFDLTAGNVILRLQRIGTGELGIRMFLLSALPGTPVMIDFRRFGNYLTGTAEGTGAATGIVRDSYSLPVTPQNIDDTLYMYSNEAQWLLLRQQEPGSSPPTWSLCEIRFFISAGGQRISTWVNWLSRGVVY